MSIKVMLADDHVLMREGIRQLLEFDCTISAIAEANNGVECMEQLLSVHPDILLLDINMPQMNGFEVLAIMKRSRCLEETPVIMISSEESVDTMRKAYEMGITDYITRPFDSVIVKKRVQNTLH